jgi:hypothetical protein
MSKLQIQYSKEIAKNLGKVAVFLPGEHIEVGDIITFPHGKSLLGVSRPFGTFKKITSLKKIGIKYGRPILSKTTNTYHFISKSASQFKSSINKNIDLGNNELPNSHSTIDIQFSAEGAIYFLAVDCKKKEIKDLNSIEKEINSKGKKMLWKNSYLVTSVTLAKRAFILQSLSKESSLTLQGDIKGIQLGNIDVSANSNFNLKKQNGNIFIKNWSNDVTVFMDVVKFEKRVFESEIYRSSYNEISLEETEFKLTKVYLNELLDEDKSDKNSRSYE